MNPSCKWLFSADWNLWKNGSRNLSVRFEFPLYKNDAQSYFRPGSSKFIYKVYSHDRSQTQNIPKTDLDWTTDCIMFMLMCNNAFKKLHFTQNKNTRCFVCKVLAIIKKIASVINWSVIGRKSITNYRIITTFNLVYYN